MRVAIFGGSFNPPHLAHQMAALYVLETAAIDELWIVPAFQHPFGKALAPFAHRLEMCELAAAALGPRVKVSAVERELGVESRTLRTVRRLQQDFPAHAFSLVIGADLLAEVPSWHGGAELQRTVPFLVVGRAGFESGRGGAVALPRVSSTEVRAALGCGAPGRRARAARGSRLHLRARPLSELARRMSDMSEAEVNARAMAEGPAEPTPRCSSWAPASSAPRWPSAWSRAGVPVTGLHGRQVELTDAARAISGVRRIDRRDPADPLGVRRGDHRGARRSHPRGGRAAGQRGAVAAASRSCSTPRGPTRRATILAAAVPHVRAVGTLHPLVSFADARVAVEGLREVAFGIEGDEPARAVAKRIVRALGARAVILEAENLALYHAGAVMASNYVVAMADTAQSLLIKAGVPADQALPVLIPLLASVVQNLAQVGLPGALTGPVERGDVTVGGASPRDAGGAGARAGRALPSGRPRRAAAGPREVAKHGPRQRRPPGGAVLRGCPSPHGREQRRRAGPVCLSRRSWCDEPGISARLFA